MNINLECLKQAMKLLPEPTHRGQVVKIPLPERMTPIVIDKDADGTETSRQLEFITEKYCEGSKCWFEWEMIL